MNPPLKLHSLLMVALAWTTSAWSSDVFVGTPPLNPLPGQQVSIEILVDVGVDTLGSYSTNFIYDPLVVEVVSLTGGTTPEFSAPPITNPASFTTGSTPIAAVQGAPLAPSGFVSVATVTLQAVGTSGEASLLDLSGTSLFSGAAMSLPATVFGSSFLIGAPQVPTLGFWGLMLLGGMIVWIVARRPKTERGDVMS